MNDTPTTLAAYETLLEAVMQAEIARGKAMIAWKSVPGPDSVDCKEPNYSEIIKALAAEAHQKEVAYWESTNVSELARLALGVANDRNGFLWTMSNARYNEEHESALLKMTEAVQGWKGVQL